MFFKSNILTTVDVGGSSIKVTKIKKKKKELSLLDLAIEKLPPGIIKEGQIQEQIIISNALKEIFKKMKYRPRNIITTIPSNNIITRNLELPIMTEKELAEAIKWEVEGYLPFPLDQAQLDYLKIAEDDENMQILLVAVKKEIIEDYLAPFKEIGLRTTVINIQPMSLLSLLQYQGRAGEPLAVIDIGSAGTRVVIGDQTNIYLSRTIDIGGEDFTQLFVEERDLDFIQAESYKKRNGIEADQTEHQFELAVEQIAATGLSSDKMLVSLAYELAKEISRSLDYFSINYRDRSLNRIYITGGGSKLKGLKEIIGQRNNIAMHTLDPFDGLDYQQRDEWKNEFAVCLGLAASEVIYLEG